MSLDDSVAPNSEPEVLQAIVSLDSSARQLIATAEKVGGSRSGAALSSALS